MPNGNYGDGNIPGRDGRLGYRSLYASATDGLSLHFIISTAPSHRLRYIRFVIVCMCLSIRVVFLRNLCSGQIITGRETDC